MMVEGSRGTVGIVRPTQRTGGWQCWDIQRHLGIREPAGIGRLIAEMPASVPHTSVTMAARRVTS